MGEIITHFLLDPQGSPGRSARVITPIAADFQVRKSRPQSGIIADYNGGVALSETVPKRLTDGFYSLLATLCLTAFIRGFAA
jgi:hypothetical protein